jgi:plastocyanin
MPSAMGGGQQSQVVQLGETFIPHVLPVVKGSTVEFPNQDPIFHNVFSLSGTKSFDLGRYPKGDSRSVTFDQPGIIPVFCHLHSDMSAIVMVLDNPYFAVPGPDGHYRIENIPAGTYTVVAWHERSEQVEQKADVIAGQALELNITVPIEDDETSDQ